MIRKHIIMTFCLLGALASGSGRAAAQPQVPVKYGIQPGANENVNLGLDSVRRRVTAYHPAVMIRVPSTITATEAHGIPAIVPQPTTERKAGSPHVALKTNFLHLATATPVLAIEAGLERKTSLEVYGSYNNWTFKDNRKWKHWIVQPAVRFWTCERFNGSFFGVHLHAGEFNVGGVGPFKNIKKYRYDGWFAGLGASYGYQWVFSNRIGLEAEIGVGYAYMKYDKFGCKECEPRIATEDYHYVGPTKASVCLVIFLR